MRIVKASSRNLKSIIDINKQLIGAKWGKESWIKKEINNENFVLIRNHIIYGAMCLQLSMEDRNEAYIATLAIKKEEQNKGLGKQLINFAKERAKQEEKTILTVESFLEYNVKDFYLSCGFQLKPKLEKYRGYLFYSFFMKI